MVNKKSGSNKKCIHLSEENKKLIKEVRERRIEGEARVKVLNQQIEDLRKRVDATNERMILLL